MTMDAAWALQSALYTALSNDEELQGVLGNPARIHDEVPADATFPLLQLGAVRMQPYEGMEGGFEHIIRMTCFSRYGGRKEGKQIADICRRILQNAQLSLEGCELAASRLVFEDHLKIADPDIYQATMRYRFVTVPLMAEVA